METGNSDIYSKPIRYWIAASMWNTASIAIFLFIGSFLLDIVSYYIGSTILSGYAYGIALLSMLSIFWVGGLALILGLFVRCDHCGSRVIKFKRRAKSTSSSNNPFKLSKIIPFSVPLTSFCCTQCNTEFKVKLK